MELFSRRKDSRILVRMVENKRMMIIICLSGLTFFYIYHCFFWYRYILDDAYITFRYAKNFINGFGLVYNPGERVEGYTSFSWLMMIAAGMKFGLDPWMVSKVLGLFSGVGTIICSWWVYNRLSRLSYSWGSIIVPLLLATSSFFCYWSIVGMGTIFFSFLLVLSLALYLKEGQSGHPFSAYALSLLCLTRPDGYGYLVIFLAADVFTRVRKKRPIDRYCLQFYGIILLSSFCFIGFRLVYYGSFFTNTYYVKAIFPFESNGLEYLLGFYRHYGILPLAALTVAVVWHRYFLKGKMWILGLLVFANWVYILYVEMDWMPNYRHHMYTLPLLFVLTALVINSLVRNLFKQKRFYGKIAVAMIVFLVIYHVRVNVSVSVDCSYRYRIKGARIFKKPADWMRRIRIEKFLGPLKIADMMFLMETAENGATVGMRDIGKVAYTTGLRIYDTMMLVNGEAKRRCSVLRSKDEKLISDYTFGEMRKGIEGYDPEIFIYPFVDLEAIRNTPRFSSTYRMWWEWSDLMYEEYFEQNMDIVGSYRKEIGSTMRNYYVKKGLARRPSRKEIIHRYERALREYPSCIPFKDRLTELYEESKKEKDLDNKRY